MSTATFLKDPQAELDYSVDWSTWLGDDTIAASEWTIAGIDASLDHESTFSDTVATCWLVGGAAGIRGQATNRITTAAGRTDERTISLMVVER